MKTVSGEAFKFFVDQVVRQYQDLKADLQREMQDLKIELKEKDRSFDERLGNAEDRITTLEQWKWYIAGAAGFAFAMAEAAIRAIDYYLK